MENVNYDIEINKGFIRFINYISNNSGCGWSEVAEVVGMNRVFNLSRYAERTGRIRIEKTGKVETERFFIN